MHIHNETKKNKQITDVFKWIIVYSLLITIIIGNYYFRKYSLVIRSLVIIIIITIATIISLYTKKGKKALIFTKESILEIKKVIWPSRQETFQITLIVIVVTTIISLILWGLDTTLIRFISYITNLNLF